jgi:hypothetical protein
MTGVRVTSPLVVSAVVSRTGARAREVTAVLDASALP